MATPAAPICGRKSCAASFPPVRASANVVPDQNTADSTWRAKTRMRTIGMKASLRTETN